MATIVEMINPLTGLPEQVDKLDHTAQEIDDAVDLAPQLSNPNLLDNWYFGNPVNQKGQTSYTEAGYTIDRWALPPSTPGSFLLHSSDNYSANVKGVFFQRIENKRFIVGAKYTLSVLRGLIASPTLYHETFTLTENVGWKSRFNVNGGTFGFYHDSNASDIQFDLNGDKTIIAVKLELGSQQTLAHQENGVWVLNEIPDYGGQLRLCQYYSRFFGEDIEVPCSNNPVGTHIEGTLPLTMRSGSGSISYSEGVLFTGNGTFYTVTGANVSSNGGRVKIGVNVNGQLSANMQATLFLKNCSILFDL